MNTGHMVHRISETWNLTIRLSTNVVINCKKKNLATAISCENGCDNHFEKIKYMPACWRMRCQRTMKILIKMCDWRTQKDLRAAFTEWKGQRSWTLDLFWKKEFRYCRGAEWFFTVFHIYMVSYIKILISLLFMCILRIL